MRTALPVGRLGEMMATRAHGARWHAYIAQRTTQSAIGLEHNPETSEMRQRKKCSTAASLFADPDSRALYFTTKNVQLKEKYPIVRYRLNKEGLARRMRGHDSCLLAPGGVITVIANTEKSNACTCVRGERRDVRPLESRLVKSLSLSLLLLLVRLRGRADLWSVRSRLPVAPLITTFFPNIRVICIPAATLVIPKCMHEKLADRDI